MKKAFFVGTFAITAIILAMMPVEAKNGSEWLGAAVGMATDNRAVTGPSGAEYQNPQTIPIATFNPGFLPCEVTVVTDSSFLDIATYFDSFAIKNVRIQKYRPLQVGEYTVRVGEGSKIVSGKSRYRATSENQNYDRYSNGNRNRSFNSSRNNRSYSEVSKTSNTVYVGLRLELIRMDPDGETIVKSSPYIPGSNIQVVGGRTVSEVEGFNRHFNANKKGGYHTENGGSSKETEEWNDDLAVVEAQQRDKLTTLKFYQTFSNLMMAWQNYFEEQQYEAIKMRQSNIDYPTLSGVPVQEHQTQISLTRTK